jgi:hypothetical protein
LPSSFLTRRTVKSARFHSTIRLASESARWG